MDNGTRAVCLLFGEVKGGFCCEICGSLSMKRHKKFGNFSKVKQQIVVFLFFV